MSTKVYDISKFIERFETIEKQYKKDKNVTEFKNSVLKLAKQYKYAFGVGDYYINIGDQLIKNGDYNAGIILIFVADEVFDSIADMTTVYLRKAEYHFINNNVQKGIENLMKLCTETSENYEESIAFRELTDVWNKYKHLVAEKVPASVVTMPSDPLPPEKCTMQIAEVFEMNGDELLQALTQHINEMSAFGEFLNCLNKWEKTVFYADLLCSQVNSGGFSHYLYYDGNRFLQTLNSVNTIEAKQTGDLLEKIQNKFPKHKVPKSTDSIQNALDDMEDRNIDFEDEDECFYNCAEKELVNKLIEYIIRNKKHFR